MKLRRWLAGLAIFSAAILAADEAPPAELLQNIDFFQNMDMIQDKFFLAANDQNQHSTSQTKVAVNPQTAPVSTTQAEESHAPKK